jgi:hypothetical protein
MDDLVQSMVESGKPFPSPEPELVDQMQANEEAILQDYQAGIAKLRETISEKKPFSTPAFFT